MGTKTTNDKDTIVKLLRMRSRDFRNGVLNTLKLKHDKIVSKAMWETIATISDAMVDLNNEMVKTNGLGDNAIDKSIRVDMTNLTAKAKEMTLTPTERKAKAKAKAELESQMAALAEQIANL